jgi:hypothetical protein
METGLGLMCQFRQLFDDKGRVAFAQFKRFMRAPFSEKLNVVVA